MTDDRIYYLMMSGRCANGFERDAGRLIHAIRSVGFPGWKPAVCNAKPGNKGNGWSDPPKPATAPTCPRCIKKLAKSEAPTAHEQQQMGVSLDTRDHESGPMARTEWSEEFEDDEP